MDDRVIRWAAWGEEAFARARAQGRPLLLLLTASWCHACHRMDEETWEDPGVAAVVEQRTVPVRADADARPEVYGRYHLGGLPTVALLTAEGDFVRGGTYLGPAEFLAFLEQALEDFAAGRRPAPRPERAPPAEPAGLVARVIERLGRRADPEHGGFGMAPKLPEPQALTLLLRAWRHSRDRQVGGIVERGLEAVLRHLWDARDGGFFRYAAGPDWSGPHTEKVALDQAALIRCFLEAGAAAGEARWVLAARHALAFVRRHLADGRGRVLASMAADPGYYARPGGARPDLPAVDRRRFADSQAAMHSAGLLGLAVTGEDPGFEPEFLEAAPAGGVPHRLDEPDGVIGLLRDQALALAAALDRYRLVGDPRALDWARLAARWSVDHLWDRKAQAFGAGPAAPAEPVRLPAVFPLLGNGEMALGLADLAQAAGEPRWREVAERVVASLAGPAARSPAGPALALAAQRLERPPAQADLEGDPGDPQARALARVVVAVLGPTTVVRWRGGVRPACTIRAGDLHLPAEGDPEALRQALAGLGPAPPEPGDRP